MYLNAHLRNTTIQMSLAFFLKVFITTTSNVPIEYHHHYDRRPFYKDKSGSDDDSSFPSSPASGSGFRSLWPPAPSMAAKNSSCRSCWCRRIHTNKHHVEQPALDECKMHLSLSPMPVVAIVVSELGLASRGNRQRNSFGNQP